MFGHLLILNLPDLHWQSLCVSIQKLFLSLGLKTPAPKISTEIPKFEVYKDSGLSQARILGPLGPDVVQGERDAKR